MAEGVSKKDDKTDESPKHEGGRWKGILTMKTSRARLTRTLSFSVRDGRNTASLKYRRRSVHSTKSFECESNSCEDLKARAESKRAKSIAVDGGKNKHSDQRQLKEDADDDESGLNTFMTEYFWVRRNALCEELEKLMICERTGLCLKKERALLAQRECLKDYGFYK